MGSNSASPVVFPVVPQKNPHTGTLPAKNLHVATKEIVPLSAGDRS